MQQALAQTEQLQVKVGLLQAGAYLVEGITGDSRLAIQVVKL